MAMTLAKALSTAQRQLPDSAQNSSLEAEILLAHTIEKDRVWVFTHPERLLSPDNERQYAGLLARRLRGEPIAHLIGYRDFYNHRFAVNQHTLIPRPETELLVDRILELSEPDQPFQMLELGTGSGVIGVSIAAERRNAVVVATDISDEALNVARLNSARLQIANIEFCCGSWYSPVPGRRFDLLVSNPPYIEDNFEGLSDTDLRFEPRHALTAGPDGLDALQVIVAGAGEALYPGGRLLLEHGATQAYDLAILLKGHGFVNIQCHKDLAGHNRMTEAVLP